MLKWAPNIAKLSPAELLHFFLHAHSEFGKRATAADGLEPSILGAAARVYPVNPRPFEMVRKLLPLLDADGLRQLIVATDGDCRTALMDACRAGPHAAPVVEELLRLAALHA